MEAALTAALLASSGLTAVFGNRINWEQLPDREAVPALILHPIPSGADTYVQAGRVPMTETVIQFDCWASTKAAALAGREALIAFLAPLAAGPPPLQAWIERRHSAWQPAPSPGADRATNLSRASLDVRFVHTES